MAARRWLRMSLTVLAVLLVVVMGALLLLPRWIDTPAMHAYVTQLGGQAVGRPVKFTSLAVSFLPLPSVSLKGLQIADDPRFGTTPFLKVDEVRVGLRVRPLLSLRIELASLTLDGARVELVESGGRWNAASLAAPAAPAKPSTRTVPGIGSAAVGSIMVSRVGVKDGVIHITRRGTPGRDLRIEGVNATVSGVGGPDLDIRGDARVEPGGLRLRDIRATVGIRSPEMPIKATLGVEGSDIAPIARALAFASPALSGPVKGTLQLSGTSARLGGTGQLDLTRVTLSQDKPHCPPPTRRQLVLDEVRVPVLLKSTGFESVPLRAKLSQGTVGLTLTATLEEPSSLVTLRDIKVSGIQLLPVLQDYLCQGYAISGPLDLHGALSMRTADVWRSMNGTGEFKVGSGKVVGEGALKLVREMLVAQGVVSSVLQGDLRGASGTSLEFISIKGSYKITSGVLRTDDTVYQTKGLTMSTAGTYGLADGRADMMVLISQSGGQFRAHVTGSGGSFRAVPAGVQVKDPEAVKRFLDRLLR
jgi:AsmA-like protein